VIQYDIVQPISFSDIIKVCSVDLFHNMKKSNHCLRELLISYAQPIEVVYVHVGDMMLS